MPRAPPPSPGDHPARPRPRGKDAPGHAPRIQAHSWKQNSLPGGEMKHVLLPTARRCVMRFPSPDEVERVSVQRLTGSIALVLNAPRRERSRDLEFNIAD